eukprot:5445682-Amphidinium_carterae.1
MPCFKFGSGGWSTTLRFENDCVNDVYGSMQTHIGCLVRFLRTVQRNCYTCVELLFAFYGCSQVWFWRSVERAMIKCLIVQHCQNCGHCSFG